MSINSTIIRWGILGCGDVTEIKWPSIPKTEGFKIEAVMRRDGDKAADYKTTRNKRITLMPMT
jgi:hypothetical protein